MTRFVAEKNFFKIFQAFSIYFLEKNMNRNWGYLIHEGSFEHYILSLVEKFYNSFTNRDVDNHAHRIHINWRGERKVFRFTIVIELDRNPSYSWPKSDFHEGRRIHEFDG